MKWISDRKLTIVLGLVLGTVMMLLQMSHFDVIIPEDFGFLLPCFSYWLAAIAIAMGGGALMGLVPLLCFIGSAMSGIVIVMVCRVVIRELTGALSEFLSKKKNPSANRRKRS